MVIVFLLETMDVRIYCLNVKRKALLIQKFKFSKINIYCRYKVEIEIILEEGNLRIYIFGRFVLKEYSFFKGENYQYEFWNIIIEEE